MKSKLIYATAVVLCVLLLVAGYLYLTGGKSFTDTLDTEYLRAEVVEITGVNEDVSDTGDLLSSDICFKAEIKSGKYKGTVVSSEQNYSSYTPLNPHEVDVGDTVIIANFGEDEWVFIDFLRSDALIVLLVLFALLILVYGRSKGAKTLLSLTLTVFSVAFVFFPAVLNGKNVSLWAVIVCLYIIVMTLVIVNGISTMSIAAACGCASGVLISLTITVITDCFIGLSGNSDSHSIFLLYIGKNGVDPLSLIYASIIIGSVGAVMDVAVDISASLKELTIKLGSPTRSELLRSGLNIGRDVIGTMSNTLILAYIGGSMCTLLLYIYNNGASPLYLFNIEAIVVEMLNILVGSIGIMMTLPITALICSVLYTNKHLKKHLVPAESVKAPEPEAVIDEFSDKLDTVGSFDGDFAAKNDGDEDKNDEGGEDR